MTVMTRERNVDDVGKQIKRNSITAIFLSSAMFRVSQL